MVLTRAQAGPSQQALGQDGAAGVRTAADCLRGRRVTAAVFQVSGRAWAGDADVLPLPHPRLASSGRGKVKPRGGGAA